MGWHHWLPYLRWWRRIGCHTLKCDAVAGLTGAIIVVPQGLRVLLGGGAS
jgi:hypothetical protein